MKGTLHLHDDHLQLRTIDHEWRYEHIHEAAMITMMLITMIMMMMIMLMMMMMIMMMSLLLLEEGQGQCVRR